MAIALRATTTATGADLNANPDSMTINVPSGTTEGDLVVLVQTQDEGDQSLPTGGNGTWQRIITGGYAPVDNIYWKQVTAGGEPATYTVNVTSAGSDRDVCAVCMAFSPDNTGDTWTLEDAGADSTSTFTITYTPNGAQVGVYGFRENDKNAAFDADVDYTETAEISAGAGSPGTWISLAAGYLIDAASDLDISITDASAAVLYGAVFKATGAAAAAALVIPPRQDTTVRM